MKNKKMEQTTAATNDRFASIRYFHAALITIVRERGVNKSTERWQRRRWWWKKNEWNDRKKRSAKRIKCWTEMAREERERKVNKMAGTQFFCIHLINAPCKWLRMR